MAKKQIFWWREIKERHLPIIVCECGIKYIKTRRGQKKCLFCINERIRPLYKPNFKKDFDDNL